MSITTDDFYEFGKWARDDNNNLCPKSQWYELVMKGNVEQSTTNISYNMTDDKASKIDKAVCQLTNYSPHLGAVFVRHYVGGESYRSLASEYGCHKSTIANQISEAGGFVIGVASASRYV